MITDILRGTPLALDDATRALYNCAITNPSSLTDAEHRTITHRPSPEEDGLVDHQAGKLFHERTRLSAADCDPTYRAIDVVTAQDMKTAQANAYHLHRQWNAISSAAFHSMNDDDRQNILYALRVPWKEYVLGLNTPLCGLLVFRAADVDNNAEWASYKQQVQTAIHYGLNWKKCSMKESAVAKFTMHWMDINAQDNPMSELRCRFNALRESDEFHAVLGKDSFLYIDREALQSRDAERLFVWFWEPDERAEPLKIDIKHIARTLFARLTQRDIC